MTPPDYLSALNHLLATGRAREHAYRGDLQQLLQTILPDTHTVINEPSQVRGVGNPDYLVRNANEVAIGYIEAKDIGKDLDDKSYREQFNRYRKGLDNLIITDYLRFDFYQAGKLEHTVTIGELTNGLIVPQGNEYDRFQNLIRDFGEYQGEPIRSPKRLAELMAGKARLLQDILHRAVEVDIEADNDSDLRGQFQTFRDILLHDLNPRQFSDLYSQTLAYGLFAARLHDNTLDNFSRQEAGELIPKSNPFLRQLFGFVAGNNIDSRIRTTVDNLADIFLLADVKNLMTDYGRATAQNDAVVHFYETFLAEYDPKLRKQRGVWYTPQPVVDFIVRAVDDLLKSEFSLKDGLADNSKIKIKKKAFTKATADRRSKVKEVEVEHEVHRVQVLDPATGTGTFLATTIKYIFEHNFKMMPGAWPDYVEQHLIPRLNGFELLMASYAMAHLKLDLTLRETGYERELGERFRVYLTNALEEDHPDAGTLFASFLSNEANEANAIKRDTPVMVVMGNPPYSGISTNKGDWITGLIDDYKYIDGEHFGERKHWLNDDYVKFIRMAEHLIEKNGEGILAFINNHSFLDNPTFRGMRWHLLQTFDDISIIDLHGNSLKKETTPDGNKDVNVFDIQAGVSINIMVRKKGASRDMATVHHWDVYGERKEKYEWLNNHRYVDVAFKKLQYRPPFYFFQPKSYEGRGEYDNGIPLESLFKVNSTGILTMGDGFAVDFEINELQTRLAELMEGTQTEESLKSRYSLGKNYAPWIINNAKGWSTPPPLKIREYDYRLFDRRYILFSKGTVWRTRDEMSLNFESCNLGLVSVRQTAGNGPWNHAWLTTTIADDSYLSNKSRERGYVFPLYIYPNASLTHASQLSLISESSSKETQKRVPNLDKKLITKIAEGLGLHFTSEKEDDPTTFAPIDLLDYIYAILHDPAYRETFAEFLKIDFPKVPYPQDVENFRELVRLGRELRHIHLLEHALIDEPLASYQGQGDNTVSRKLTKNDPGWIANEDEPTVGKVWINEEQYFADVPLAAWEFYIGGYQPAQKWLKDRRDRQLSYNDIRHYLRIIRALTETERLMEELRGMAEFSNP